MQRKTSLLWSILFVGVLLIAYANTCLADPEKNTSQVKVTLPFAKENLSIEKKGEYDRVSLKDAMMPQDEPGTPWLPASFVNVRVPDGAKVVSVSVDVLKETLIAKGLNVYPVQPSVTGHQPRPEFVKPKADAYKSKDKKELGKSASAQQMREYTFVPVRINPVRLIAATGELYLAESVEITVEYQANPQAARAKAKGKRKDDPFENMMRKIVVNPDISYKSLDSEAPAPSSSEPIPSVESAPAPEPAIEQILLPASAEYLIITSSTLAASFQALADHRAAFNGVTTKILTTGTIYTSYAGADNQQKIRACIKDHVTNHGTLYVLLGGHSGIVPARYLNLAGANEPGVPSDLYYAGLDGTWNDIIVDGYYGQEFKTDAECDLIADVFLGRLPMGSTAQVSQYISKLIKFEKTPPAGIEKKLMINGAIADSYYTGDSRPSDLMNDGHLAFRDANHPKVTDAEMWMRRLYRDCVQSHGWQASQFGVLMDSLTSWDSSTGGSYPANATNMVTRFNEGWNFVINSTHASPDLLGAEGDDFTRTTHAPSLTGLTTIFYTDSCQSAKWDTSYSMSISMLSNPNGGALAYLGHARNNSYTGDSSPASNDSTGGVADDYPRALANVIFGDRAPYLGEAFVAHQLKMNAIASVISEYKYNMYRETMYGVSLLGDPLLAVRTEVTRPLVATHPKFVKPNQAFVIKITRDGLAVKGSTVRIFNANERYEAITDASGNAAFTLTTVSLSGMKVVATAPNSFPYQGEMYVQLNATPLVLVTATDAAASETAPNPGTWTFSRSDNIASSLTVSFSLGGTATQASDYTLPTYSSLTFPAGAASAVLTLTPVDDTVFGELTETAILTLLPNSAYTIAGSPAATISIADNDNAPPVVNASQDQLAYLKASPWKPSDSLPPIAWYDAADQDTLTVISGGVSQWRDKSGNSRHVSQSVTTLQPSISASTISFDGTDDYLMHNAAFMYAAGSVDIYMAAAVANTVDKRIVSENNSALSNQLYNLVKTHPTTGSIMSSFIRSDDGTSFFPTPPSLSATGAFSRSLPNIYQWRDTGSTVSARVAGGSATSASYTRSKALTLNRFTLGAIGPRVTGTTAGSYFANAGMNEVVITPILNEDDRQRMEGYLAHKWGSVSGLPAAHPYKSSAPGSILKMQLNGTASDVESAQLVIAWSKVSGPGTVVFANPSAASTQATFSVEGVYTLRLSVNDGTTQTTDDVVITVKLNKAPVVSAGTDRTVASLSNQPWTPNTGITPAAWFDAADLTTLTEVSGAISQWRDKSGRSKHANQATSTARPAPLGLINGVHALTFDGSSDYMTVPTMGSSGSAYLVYVAQPVNDTSFTVMAPNAWEVYNGSAYPKVFRSAQIGPVYPGFPTNAAYIAAYEANSATPIYNVYNNGARKVSSTAAFTFSDNWSAINTSGSNKMAGQIGEILALNYMPSTEARQKIEGYLAHKWGLLAGLPADHPYKVTAPGPPAIATLNGAASDVDGIPLPMTSTWTLVSGPQPVVFTNPKAATTDVLFTAPGVYRFRLTADDSLDQVMDECLITISSVVVMAIVDADIDGMDDAWETTYFGGTGVSNGSGDSDGDGSSDQQEYLAGTNPKDSNSLLKIASTTTISKTEMVLTFNAVTGKTYKLLASSDLTASSWQPIQTGIIGVSPTTSVTVPINNATRFFIIGVE